MFCIATCVGFIICFAFSTLYVGRLKSRLLDIFFRLNSLAIKCEIMDETSYHLKKRLLTSMKELASDEENDQFVMGLTDGKGAATSLEIFHLTLETISMTLMFLQFIFVGNNN